MKKKILHYSIIILIILGIKSHVISQQYIFRTYSLEEGLPQSEVWDLHQDSRGYLWVGTNGGGLCRFNGLQFEVFTEKDGLVDNQVRQIFEDSQGNFWLATFRGISKYDGLRFQNYTEKEGFPAGTFFRISEDPKVQGKIWVYAFRGRNYRKLLFYEPGESKFSEFKFDNLFHAPDEHFLRLFRIKNGNLLFISNKNVYEFDGNKTFISSLNDLCGEDEVIMPLLDIPSEGIFATILNEENEDKNKFVRISPDYNIEYIELPPPFNANQLRSLMKDKDGNFWFTPGLSKAGLVKFDGLEYTIFSNSNGLPVNVITTLEIDTEGNIWIGTSGSGLLKYEGDQFTYFNTKDGLKSDIVRSIFQDSKGNFWFGTSDGGVSKFDGRNITNYLYEKEKNINIINDIVETEYGNLLMSGNRGVMEYNGQDFSFVNEKFGLKPNTRIQDIEIIDNEYWFVIFGLGVARKTKDSTIIYTPESHGLASELVYSLDQDSRGNIWICCGFGISRLTEDGFTNYSKEDGLGDEMIFQFAEDEFGRLWFNSFGGGIYLYNNGIFSNISTESGLSSDLVYSIMTDSQGNIWAGTQLGVDRISISDDGSIKDIKHFGKYDGFVGVETNGLANFMDRDGNLWFGTIKGAMKYKPGETELNTVPPNTKITDVKLFFKKIDWTSDEYRQYSEGVTKWRNLPVNLRLPHQKKHLTFRFEALSYTVPERIRYKFMLDGLDNNWSPATQKTEVIYPNVPSGQYTFKVLACNNDGIWNKEPAEFSFEIIAPFWMRWHFWLLAISFILGAVYAGIKLRFRAIQARQKELEKLVEEKTSEIRNQNEELLDLNQEKNHLISIVAHDLRNPLTSSLTIANLLKTESSAFGEEHRENISFLVNALERMSKLVNRILDIRVIESKKLDLKPEPTNVIHILREINAFYKDALQKKDIELHLDSDDDNYYIEVDRNYATQVFDNLVSNAIKFSPPHKRIHIRLTGQNGTVRTEVKDEGPGLTAEDKKKLFKRFQKLSAKPTGNEKSTGIGLSIVKKFVEAMDGKVWVESEPGKGSTFFVEFRKAGL